MIACVANVEPDFFVEGNGFVERTLFLRVPVADVSTCRSKGQDGIVVERMYEVACKGLRLKARKMEMSEDYDSRPIKLLKFELRCQEVIILKAPKPLPKAFNRDGRSRIRSFERKGKTIMRGTHVNLERTARTRPKYT